MGSTWSSSAPVLWRDPLAQDPVLKKKPQKSALSAKLLCNNQNFHFTNEITLCNKKRQKQYVRTEMCKLRTKQVFTEKPSAQVRMKEKVIVK